MHGQNHIKFASILVGGKFQCYLRRVLYRTKYPKREKKNQVKMFPDWQKNIGIHRYLFIYLFMVNSTVSSAPQDRMNSK